jgi:hypothetical protein
MQKHNVVNFIFTLSLSLSLGCRLILSLLPLKPCILNFDDTINFSIHVFLISSALSEAKIVFQRIELSADASAEGRSTERERILM